jgi:hypothetical protein
MRLSETVKPFSLCSSSDRSGAIRLFLHAAL